jgi:hypothetical protein
MKITHISDIHLSTKYKPWSFHTLQKLVKTIAGLDDTHLVRIGDLTDNADEHDFITFRNMLKSFDLLKPVI